jgi:hypothetical protein
MSTHDVFFWVEFSRKGIYGHKKTSLQAGSVDSMAI